MPWGVAAAAGASLIGSAMQSDAASSASDAQVASSEKATQAQLQMFHESQQNLAPYYGVGANAMNQLAANLGIGGTNYAPANTQTLSQMGTQAPAASATNSQSNNPYFNDPSLLPPHDAEGMRQWLTAHAMMPNFGNDQMDNLGKNRLLVYTPQLNTMKSQLLSSGQMTTGGFNANGSYNPMGAAPRSAARPAQQITQQQQPSNSIAPTFKLGGAFTNADLNAQMAPNYQFQLDQGMKAFNNSAAAQNGVLSGSALKGMQDYVQGTAAGAYQNAFSNWMGTQNMNFGQLYNLASLGENAAAGSGSQAVATGQSIGQNMIGAGNAQAAGQIGSANAWSNGLSSAGGYSMLNSMSGNKPGIFDKNSVDYLGNNGMGYVPYGGDF